MSRGNGYSRAYGQSGNTQMANQSQHITSPKPNWKAKHTSHQCREKGHVAIECPHTGNFTITQRQQALIVSTQETGCAGPTLFPAMNLHIHRQ